jgi:transcriptional antiterminator NusG
MELTGWFAVRTKTGCEQVATWLLNQKGYECLLPTYAERAETSCRVVEKNRPLFPGYLFCRLTELSIAKIVTTPTVLGIVSFGGKPASVTEEEIASLRAVMNSGLPREPLRNFSENTRVRIESGPLKGAVGTFLHSTRKGKFVVSIALLQRSVSVELQDDVVVACVAESSAELRNGAMNSQVGNNYLPVMTAPVCAKSATC